MAEKHNTRTGWGGSQHWYRSKHACAQLGLALASTPAQHTVHQAVGCIQAAAPRRMARACVAASQGADMGTAAWHSSLQGAHWEGAWPTCCSGLVWRARVRPGGRARQHHARAAAPEEPPPACRAEDTSRPGAVACMSAPNRQAQPLTLIHTLLPTLYLADQAEMGLPSV